jgi:peroxiredoxin
MPVPNIGERAPEINLPCCVGERRERFILSDYQGKKNVVLVFYPLDWTPV